MGPNHLKMGGQWNVGTGLARVSEEGELTEPSVEETDCLTCDEASLCEPACSRGRRDAHPHAYVLPHAHLFCTNSRYSALWIAGRSM